LEKKCIRLDYPEIDIVVLDIKCISGIKIQVLICGAALCTIPTLILETWGKLSEPWNPAALTRSQQL
jgi:hypothetical protein